MVVRAGVWEEEGGWSVVLARCFRLKRARKREARGEDSERRVVRRVLRVSSSKGVAGGDMAAGVILAVLVWVGVVVRWRRDGSWGRFRKNCVD